MKRFREGLVCNAHRHLHHSTLGSREIQKKKEKRVHSTPRPSNAIPRSFLKPFGRSWTHFVEVYRQKLTNLQKLTSHWGWKVSIAEGHTRNHNFSKLGSANSISRLAAKSSACSKGSRNNLEPYLKTNFSFDFANVVSQFWNAPRNSIDPSQLHLKQNLENFTAKDQHGFKWAVQWDWSFVKKANQIQNLSNQQVIQDLNELKPAVRFRLWSKVFAVIIAPFLIKDLGFSRFLRYCQGHEPHCFEKSGRN